MVNRRQFFQNLLKRGPGINVSDQQRRARRQALETHVQTVLLPTDFALTKKEKSQLGSRVRSVLDKSSDEDLFSDQIVERLTHLVEGLVDAFRMASAEVTPHREPNELRAVAVQTVTRFLDQTEDQRIASITDRLQLRDRVELEDFLTKELKRWLETISDAEILAYDRVSIQEPALDRLRIVCGQDPDP